MSLHEDREAITDTVVKGVADVTDRVVQSATKLQRDGSAIRDSVGKTASQLSDQVSHTLKDAGVDTDDLKNAFGAAWGKLGEATRDVVRTRPLGAVLAAAAVGILFGVISNR